MGTEEEQGKELAVVKTKGLALEQPANIKLHNFQINREEKHEINNRLNNQKKKKITLNVVVKNAPVKRRLTNIMLSNRPRKNVSRKLFI